MSKSFLCSSFLLHRRDLPSRLCLIAVLGFPASSLDRSQVFRSESSQSRPATEHNNPNPIEYEQAIYNTFISFRIFSGLVRELLLGKVKMTKKNPCIFLSPSVHLVFRPSRPPVMDYTLPFYIWICGSNSGRLCLGLPVRVKLVVEPLGLRILQS